MSTNVNCTCLSDFDKTIDGKTAETSNIAENLQGTIVLADPCISTVRPGEVEFLGSRNYSEALSHISNVLY